ncbi:MAG: EAL domain-containing protein [Pseudomonadota bacterium]|nr:EAL domain-containing protein [Pseudomonadota bacterium]
MKQQLPYLVGFSLAVAGAFAAIAYLFGGGQQQILAMAVGIGFLAFGQLFVLGMTFDNRDRLNFRLRKLAQDSANMQSETDANFTNVFEQLAKLEAQAFDRSGQLIAGVENIKTNFEVFKTQMHAGAANVVSAAPVVEVATPEEVTKPHAFTAETVAPVTAEAPEPDLAASFAKQINYALEPLVDIPTRRTAHYRLHSSMTIEGEDVSDDTLFRAAVIAKVRPALDRLAIEEALGLLARLRGRDEHLCILVPLGAETLQDQASIVHLLRTIEASPMANGLIVELQHVILAGLGEQGLEGLAQLARQGVVFALSQASIGGLDLEAMRLLNVKLVGIAAGSLGGQPASHTLLGFAQMARLARVNVYVTEVTNAAMVPHIAAFSRLVCGPCFAAPRRVKRVTALPNTDTALAA